MIQVFFVVLGVLTAIGVAILIITTLVDGELPFRKKCAAGLCSGRADPRCAGKNCTFHCAQTMVCNGRCLDVWFKNEMENDAIRKAIAEELH